MTPGSGAVLSLFPGAGGFSYGFAAAGLKPRCGAEIDRDGCRTYENNVGGTCHALDLTTVRPSFFKDMPGGREPFALIRRPPCQGFRTAGAPATRATR